MVDNSFKHKGSLLGYIIRDKLMVYFTLASVLLEG